MVEIQASMPQFSPRDFVAVLFRRQRPILACFASIVTVTMLYCFFWPPTYEAGVRFLVRGDRLDPVITADPQSVRMLSRPIVTEDDMNAESVLLTSQAVLESTVRDLKLDALPEHWAIRTLSWPGERLGDVYRRYHHKSAPTKFARAVTRLRKSITVVPQKKSAILDVRLRWGNPEFAVRVLEQLSRNYTAQSLAVRGRPNLEGFFRVQAEAMRTELSRIEREIEGIRPGASAEAIEFERQLAIQQSADFEMEWRKSSVREAELQARVGGLGSELSSLPERVVTEDRPSSALEDVQQKVAQLELRRSEVTQKYQPSHRVVAEAEEELREARAVLGQMQVDLSRARTTDANPVVESVQGQLSGDRARLLAAAAASERARSESAAFAEKAAALKRDALSVERLERERRAKEASYLQYVKRHEEARVDDQMNRMLLANVTAIEPVRAGANPVKPRAGALLKLALALGLLCSVGVGFALELLDHRMKSERDVERHLGVPVLASLERFGRTERTLAKASNGHGNRVRVTNGSEG